MFWIYHETTWWWHTTSYRKISGCLSECEELTISYVGCLNFLDCLLDLTKIAWPMIFISFRDFLTELYLGDLMKHLMAWELKHSAVFFKKIMTSNFTNSSNVEFFREISNAEILYRWLDIKLAINRNRQTSSTKGTQVFMFIPLSVQVYIFAPCSSEL